MQELRGAKQERDEALHKINEMQGSGAALTLKLPFFCLLM